MGDPCVPGRILARTVIRHVTVHLDRPMCGCKKPAVSTALQFDENGAMWLVIHCVRCRKGVRKPVDATEFRLAWPRRDT